LHTYISQHTIGFVLVFKYYVNFITEVLDIYLNLTFCYILKVVVMVSIARVVEKIVKENPSLEIALSKDIVSYAKLAR